MNDTLTILFIYPKYESLNSHMLKGIGTASNMLMNFGKQETTPAQKESFINSGVGVL